MGRKQPQGWQPDTSHRGQWGYWRGSYSPHQRGNRRWEKGDGKGKDGKNAEKFPRYDARKVDPDAPLPTAALPDLETAAGSGDYVGALQAHLNAARRSETRVRNLEQAKKQKQAQWQAYEAGLQKSYQQEKERHAAAMTRLEDDLRTAMANQARSRHVLRCAHAASQGQVPGEVAATGTDPDWLRGLPVSLKGGPSLGPPAGAASEPHGPVQDVYFGGLPGDPFATSPSTTAIKTPLRGHSPPHRPKPTAPRSSVKAHTPPQLGRSSKVTLETKLEERRAALQTTELRPALEKPVEATAEQPTRSSVLVEDDDEELEMAAHAGDAIDSLE